MYLHACTPNARLQSRRDRKGRVNIVALYRRTRKGERQEIYGQPLGSKGIDGSDFYELRIGADGVLYCSCADYAYRGHRWNRAHRGQTPYACKHIVAAMAHFAEMARRGVSRDSEMIVYQPEVLVAVAAQRAAAAAAQARRTA
jgi:hypothetical protein